MKASYNGKRTITLDKYNLSMLFFMEYLEDALTPSNSAKMIKVFNCGDTFQIDVLNKDFDFSMCLYYINANLEQDETD